MTATTTFTSATRQAQPESATTPKHVWRTGMLAGVTASVATSAVAAGAQALDVSFKVGGEAIPVAGFAQLTFIGAVIGTILAVVLSRRANHPKRTFLTTTLVLTVLSIVPDVLADAHTSTRFTLALTHVVAAAIVIPALASRLSEDHRST
jgi:peptidoglycan/LPS O-acetylase OafA/YrhL